MHPSPAAKEKAWGQFYQAVVRNHTVITDITHSAQLTSFVCLRLFKKLLAMLTQNTPVPVFPKTPNHKRDIISYIGGSVVSKLKKAAWRLTDGEKSTRLQVPNLLVSTDNEPRTSGLTDILDRGELIRLKPNVVEMFNSMEATFSTIFSDKINLSVSDFVLECCRNDNILCGYYERVYSSHATDNMKDQLLRNILQLYFKIRVHQRCRIYMDKVRYQKRMSKKAKSLRKNLHQKSDNSIVT